MQQGSMGEVPGRRLTGPASRFDRYGVRHGLPYASDAGYDEPDSGYGDEPSDTGYGGPDPYDDARDDADGPPAWSTLDGDLLTLPVPVWTGWRRRYRPTPWSGPRPWPPRRPRPWSRPPLGDRLDRLGRLVSGARRIGTLRARRTGERFPLYGARIGARSWRIVARPRGGMSREIVLMRPAEEMEAFPLGGSSGEQEAFPLSASPPEDDADGGAPGTTRDGYRLRLPHAGVHTIMARLQPDQLRDLTGGDLPADPARALVGSLARLAQRARRAGTLRSRGSGQRLSVFRAPGYRILARPRGAREAEILLVKPVEGELEVYGARHPQARRRGPGGNDYRVRGTRGAITWSGPHPLQHIVGSKPAGGKINMPAAGGGIYLVMKDNVPIYLGQALNFHTRWHKRFHLLQELEFTPDFSRYTIWFGALTPDDPADAAVRNKFYQGKASKAEQERLEDLYLDAESVLIRAISRKLKQVNRKLTNDTSFRSIFAAPKGIEIRNQAPGVSPQHRQVLFRHLPETIRIGAPGPATPTYEGPWG